MRGAPSFAVRPEVVGRDVSEYDVFFVGPHLADARALEVVNEATGECLSWSHFEGRARDARVSTAVPGGSSEVHRSPRPTFLLLGRTTKDARRSKP